MVLCVMRCNVVYAYALVDALVRVCASVYMIKYALSVHVYMYALPHICMHTCMFVILWIWIEFGLVHGHAFDGMCTLTAA